MPRLVWFAALSSLRRCKLEAALWLCIWYRLVPRLSVSLSPAYCMYNVLCIVISSLASNLTFGICITILFTFIKIQHNGELLL